MIKERNTQNVIDLDAFRSPGVIVLSGRPKGVALRRKLNLSVEDESPIPVDVIVPEEIVSLNSSFFLGLFAESVQRLGEASFLKKYIFRCPPEIWDDIESGIRHALEESNPLPEKR